MGDPQTRDSDWEAKAAAKRKETLKRIPKRWLLPEQTIAKAKESSLIVGGFIESLLDKDTLTITNRTPEANRELMAKGALSAFDHVAAFCKRAAIAHQLNHNLLEIRFERAMARAKQLDGYFREHGELYGPLHGMPYTTKDQFHIKGLDTTMAYVGWIGTQGGRVRTIDTEDFESEVVSELEFLGAIPIAKTTLAQSLWCAETNNNILGYLKNPNNQRLSAGGSSGGEGALHALRGAAFGLGTCIGGSVAMPAAFNGVYSLKPSHGRISFKDTVNSSPGQMVIPTVVGIFSQSVPMLENVFKALLSTKPWLRDPEVLPIPYREDTLPETLALGTFGFDHIVRPHPPVERAMRYVAKAMAKDGHEESTSLLVDWYPPSHITAKKLFPLITGANSRVDVVERAAVSGEQYIPEIEGLFAIGGANPIPLTDFFKYTAGVQQYRSNYAAYWNSTKKDTSTKRPVDAVIMPVNPNAAPVPGKMFHGGYTSALNVLDYCSVVIPVTTADKVLDVKDHDYQPESGRDRNTWAAYDAEIFHGTPVGIQIVGRKLEEEKILAVAQRVVQALQNHKASIMASEAKRGAS